MSAGARDTEVAAGTTPPELRSSPLWRYIEAALAQSVSQEAAWLMWRVVFPRATRSIFRAQWKDVAEWMGGAPL